MIRGREFLVVAQEMAAGTTEAHWRAAAGRAYYALMQEARATLERWGFLPPPRDNIHSFVRLRFTFAAHPDLDVIADALDELIRLRNHADYRLTVTGPFGTPHRARQAIIDAQQAITRLDQIEADPARRVAAIAAIRAAFP